MPRAPSAALLARIRAGDSMRRDAPKGGIPMKTTIVSRQITVFDEWKTLAEKKLAKLDKFFDEESTNATVTFSKRKNKFTVEITIFSAGTVFRCESTEDDFRDAIDRAVEVIERQILRNKTRLEKRLRSAAFVELPPMEDIEEEAEFTIRKKSFPVRPMSPEEAILQMNLVDHNFFIFEDESTGDICVVYKRKDDTYGLITPLHE
jgi:putative sigma-54 modulation protein